MNNNTNGLQRIIMVRKSYAEQPVLKQELVGLHRVDGHDEEAWHLLRPAWLGWQEMWTEDCREMDGIQGLDLVAAAKLECPAAKPGEIDRDG